MNKKRITLVVIFVFLVMISLFVGAYGNLTIKNLINGDEGAWDVFLRSRIPRTLVIILTASSLSIAGLIMQALNRNKFISPSTAGTNSAAALGVLLSFIILGSSSIYIKFGFAFVFAMVSSVFFVLILSKIKFKNIVYVPLIGLMYGGLISAITSLIAYETDTLQLLSSLNLGTFSHVGIVNGVLILITLPALIFAVIFSKKFNIAALGEDFATNLGLNYKLTLYVGLSIVSVIVASTFIVVGPLPFIGLIIPNIVSLYYGDNIERNLFDVAIFGSIFVLFNDILGRLIIHPFEMSVSFTMGITGAVVFIYLILRQAKANG